MSIQEASAALEASLRQAQAAIEGAQALEESTAWQDSLPLGADASNVSVSVIDATSIVKGTLVKPTAKKTAIAPGSTMQVSEQLCDNCGIEAAQVRCEADRANLCGNCDWKIHSVSQIAQKHTRVPINQAAKLSGKDQRPTLLQRSGHSSLSVKSASNRKPTSGQPRWRPSTAQQPSLEIEQNQDSIAHNSCEGGLRTGGPPPSPAEGATLTKCDSSLAAMLKAMQASINDLKQQGDDLIEDDLPCLSGATLDLARETRNVSTASSHSEYWDEEAPMTKTDTEGSVSSASSSSSIVVNSRDVRVEASIYSLMSARDTE
jgi:hypothetical protein